MAIMPGISQAITIDFTDSTAWSGAAGNNPYTSTVQYQGIDVTASADPSDVGLFWDSTDGLGVDPDKLLSYEKDEIEGKEILTISFSKMVEILEIGLSDLFIESGVGNSELFKETGVYWINNDLSTAAGFASNTTGNNGEVNLGGLSLLAYSISFAAPGLIGVEGYKGLQDHEYSLHHLNVAPVPLPAAFWMFGSALLGFVTVSRRVRL